MIVYFGQDISFVLHVFLMRIVTSKSMKHPLNYNMNSQLWFCCCLFFLFIQSILQQLLKCSLNTLKSHDCRHNSFKTLVIYDKTREAATPFCVTAAARWSLLWTLSRPVEVLSQKGPHSINLRRPNINKPYDGSGGWLGSILWVGSVSRGEIEQEKASKLWPRVICTSRVTSLGPLGCGTMQRILDLFTPHLASKAPTTGGGRGRVKDGDHGSICRLWTRRESSASLLNTGTRSADSRLDSICSWWEDRLKAALGSEVAVCLSHGRWYTRREHRQDATCRSQ